MDPAALIPSPDTIPVAWGWFEFFLLVTFACHLLLMNALLGGVVLALFGGRPPQGPGAELAKRLPTTLALTVNLGVPPLLFLQVLYGQFLYSAAVLSAVYWMLLVVVVMVSYGLLYVHAGRAKRGLFGGSAGLPLPLAVGGLLLTSFILTNVMSLMVRPEAWSQYFFNARGTILNLGDPTLLPRWLHFVFASLAGGGLFVAALNHRAQGSDQHAASRVRRGMKWFSVASLVQVGIGLWWLLTLPREIMLLFMGGNTLYTAVFVAGLIGTVAILVMGFSGRVWGSVGALVATVLVMVGMRDLLRMAYLKPYFHPSMLEVTGQYGSLVLFLVSFAAGLGGIAYMFSLHRKAGGGI